MLAIYGTGGAGKESLQTALYVQKLKQQWRKIVFIDDTKPAGEFKGYEMLPYMEFCEKYSPKEIKIHVALGEVTTKKKIAEKVMKDGYCMESLVNPHAIIGQNVVINPGVQIKMGAVIGDGTVLGNGTWVQAYTTVGNNCQIGEFCQIGAKACVGDNCRIGETTFVGMHAIISGEINVGDNVIVGMASWVNENLESDVTCIGVPARVVGKDKKHRVFK